MGPTRMLANYACAAKYDDLPQEVVAHAKIAILNILAVALGGYKTRIGKLHLELAKETGGGIPESTLIGDGEKVSCPFAAYANGNLAFALDYEDVVLYTLHAGPVVIPAALAVGEKVNASGKDFILATVLGYEIGTRIGLSMQPSPERGAKVWGQQYTPFAPCVSAGKLLGLTSNEMDIAFGVTGTYATVPSAYKYFGIVEETRPMREVKLGWGWMSMAGVFGALSAKKGFRGGHGVLDGDEGFWIMSGSDRCDFEKMTEGLGTTYLIQETDFKVHPSIAWNHPPHTGIKALLEAHDIKPENIEGVTVRGLGADRIADYDPAGPVDAMFSLPYTVATTILQEKLVPDMYSHDKLNDPRIKDMLKKIRIEPDAEADRIWFEEHRMVCSIDIHLHNGKKVNAEVEYPKDKPPFGKPEVKDKFRTLSALTLSGKRVEEIVEMVENLDELDDISALAVMLKP
jgi:2-methylcitrate dehydratase PrpD